jgi:hypothetical protein
MRDDRVELLFRIASTVFRSRNFKSDGSANLNMGLRYELEIARHFAPRSSRLAALAAEGRAISEELGRDSVGRLRAILDFVRGADVRDVAGAHRFASRLGTESDAADLRLLARIKSVHRDLEAVMDHSNQEDCRCADAV